MQHYDFCGYATRNDMKCTDMRTIRGGAFKHQDGEVVPLVWNHDHKSQENIIGKALLEDRPDGVYCYGSFNDTDGGIVAKKQVMHGDITHLSIFANGLKQQKYKDGSKDVLHGDIKEVSLVLAGANPGAYIEDVDIYHSDDPDYDEEFSAVIYNDEELVLHSDEKDDEEDEKKKPEPKKEEPAPKAEEPEEESETEEAEAETEEDAEDTSEDEDEDEKSKIKHADNSDKEDTKMAEGKEKTVQDVFNELTEEQKNVVYFMIGEAIKAKGGESAAHSEDYDEEDTLMHTNIFESERDEFLAHAEDVMFGAEGTNAIFKAAKKNGSLKDAVLEHAASNNIVDSEGDPAIDWLFPDSKTLTDAPEFINIRQEFVTEFMSRVHKTPFTRIKSMFADLTEAEARAKGYVKGNEKIDQVFSLLRRETTPTTVYKKQTLDRDDVLDITDFDVVAWLKGEMRIKLDEELVRAMLVGDGRAAASADKINEQCIRPIWTDDATLFVVNKVVEMSAADLADEDKVAKQIIRAAIKARKDYRGSGNPIFFTNDDTLTTMLLLTDDMGRDLYDTMEKLSTKLRVSKIVTSEIMDNLTRTVSGQTRTLRAIIVNPADYNVGTDKGGQVSMFDDFDIDFNKMKYLIETRCSGALIKPFSAIVIETAQSA